MERIKAYFEEQIKTDEALKAVYDESKLKQCWDYILNQARKLATSNCAMVEDAVVYKWARDYMLGDVVEEKTAEKKEEPVTVQEEAPAEEEIETVADTPAEETPAAEELPEAEENAETEEEIEPDFEQVAVKENVPEEKPAEKKEKPAEKKEEPKEPEQLFLFDF